MRALELTRILCYTIFMMRSGLFILLLLMAAVPGFSERAVLDADLVFYDSMEQDASGAQVLKGGVYKDPAQGARLREKSLMSAPVPADGYYHIRYVVDARSRGRAEDYVRLFLSNPAFASVADRFKIEYVEGDPERMNCRNDVPESPRIIRCDMDYILSLATAPVHMTGVFTSRGSGGAGGSVTIVSLDYPLNTMLHETLHTWGLNDEYEYSQSEADYYCKYPKVLKGPNTSSFPVRDAYASDSEARGMHQGDIPWLNDIAAPIVYGVPAGPDTEAGTVYKLGTPSVSPVKEPGLYAGSNCSRKMPSFRPYQADTIMRSLSTTWIPPIHQKAVLAAIAKAAGW